MYSENEIKLFAGCCSIVYISCFTSITAYYTDANFGRVEIFALLFMLILLIVVDKQCIRWLTPILALLTVATHLILVSFYVPFVGIILLYQMIERKDTRKSTLFLLASTVCVVLAGFILYVVFPDNTFMFKTPSELYQYLSDKTDLATPTEWIQAIMYGELGYHLDGWNAWMSSPGKAVYNILCVIINIPLLSAFIVFWINCIKNCMHKVSKIVFYLPLLVIPFHFIAFLMFFDYGRWMIMILTVQFMLLLYMIYNNNLTVISTIKKINPYIDKYKYVIVMMCLLMVFLGPVNQVSVSPRITLIMSKILAF